MRSDELRSLVGLGHFQNFGRGRKFENYLARSAIEDTQCVMRAKIGK